MQIYKPTDSVTIHREGTRVYLLQGGKVLLDMPWEGALEVGRALVQLGKQGEQISKMEQVIADQAVLMRAGAPIALTGNHAAQQEALKEAMWNPSLRKYMPDGVGKIETAEAFGLPTVTVSKR